MNLVKNEKLENNSHELQFSIDAEAFNAAIAKAFKREAGKYNIPGFRKGKAPRHMIEKMFGADVFHYDAINDLFPEAYEAAVAESGIEPVDRPEVDIVSASTEDGVVLKAVVTVKPEMKVGEYKGLKATKKVSGRRRHGYRLRRLCGRRGFRGRQGRAFFPDAGLRPVHSGL